MHPQHGESNFNICLGKMHIHCFNVNNWRIGVAICAHYEPFFTGGKETVKTSFNKLHLNITGGQCSTYAVTK